MATTIATLISDSFTYLGDGITFITGQPLLLVGVGISIASMLVSIVKSNIH